jgi:two-component system LytT family response regulator
MINAIIIDDEAHCIRRLETILKERFSESLRLAGSFSTVEEGLAAVASLRPELVFLDVQIHDRTGFELLAQVKEVDFDVIFTTAYEKYALKAFKFSAVDYLLKPVDPDELAGAVSRVTERMAHREVTRRLETLFHNLKRVPGTAPRISIPTLDGLIFLDAADIIRCQSSVNYTILYLKDGQKITVSRTLKEFEDLLSDHDFFRVHHSHLINLGYIKRYHKGKGGSLTMTDGAEVEVSTRRKAEFLKRLAVTGL